MGTRPPPGRCPGRAQKYRPRACPCREGACPEERRGQGGLSAPFERREASDPAPSGKTGAPLGRGLGHPGAQPRLPAMSLGPAPPRSIRRIPARLRPRRPALGSPERPRRAAPRPRGALTCAAAATLRAPRSALRKLPAGPLPQPRPGGRGRRPRPANQKRPSDARGQSAPCRPAPGGFDGNIPKGSLRLARLFPTHSPRAAAQWTFPPRLSHGRLYHRRARRGDLRLGPCQSRGRKATSSQWEAGAPGPRAGG